MLVEKFATNNAVKVNEVVNELVKDFRAFKDFEGLVINGITINSNKIKAITKRSSQFFQPAIYLYDNESDNVLCVWIKDIETIYYCYNEAE